MLRTDRSIYPLKGQSNHFCYQSKHIFVFLVKSNLLVFINSKSEICIGLVYYCISWPYRNMFIHIEMLRSIILWFNRWQQSHLNLMWHLHDQVIFYLFMFKDQLNPNLVSGGSGVTWKNTVRGILPCITELEKISKVRKGGWAIWVGEWRPIRSENASLHLCTISALVSGRRGRQITRGMTGE